MRPPVGDRAAQRACPCRAGAPGRRARRPCAGACARPAARRPRGPGWPCGRLVAQVEELVGHAPQYRVRLGRRDARPAGANRDIRHTPRLSSAAMKRGRMLAGSALLMLAALVRHRLRQRGPGVKGRSGRRQAAVRLRGLRRLPHVQGGRTRRARSAPTSTPPHPARAASLLQLRKPGGVMPSFTDKLSRQGEGRRRRVRRGGQRLRQGGRQAVRARRQAAGRLQGRQHRMPRAGLRQPGLQRGARSRRSRSCRHDGDEHRRRRRLPPHRAPHGLGGAHALQGQGRRRVHRGVAGLLVGLLPRDRRARVPRPADDKLAVVARQLCSDPQITVQRFLAYQCIHGLGHGLMIYTGYDLPGSLKTCDGLQTGFDRVSCSGGVFMENFTSSYGVTSKYLRKNDPIYPCNAVAERHKLTATCSSPPTALKLNGYDRRRRPPPAGAPRRLGQHVLRVLRPRRLRARRQGRDKALANCRLAKRHESECLYGVSRDITSSDAGGVRAGRFCARSPKPLPRPLLRGRRLGARLDRDDAAGAARACRQVGGAACTPACAAPASSPRRRSLVRLATRGRSAAGGGQYQAIRGWIDQSE